MSRKVFKTSTEMYPIVEAYLSTDQTQKQFSLREDIPLHIFGYWVRKYKAEQADQDSYSGKKFIPVKVIVPEKSSNVIAKESVSIKYKNGTHLIFTQVLDWNLLEKIMLQLNNDNL